MSIDLQIDALGSAKNIDYGDRQTLVQKIFIICIKPFFGFTRQVALPVFAAVVGRADVSLFSFDALVCIF
jgi:hypothetical protein